MNVSANARRRQRCCPGRRPAAQPDGHQSAMLACTYLQRTCPSVDLLPCGWLESPRPARTARSMHISWEAQAQGGGGGPPHPPASAPHARGGGANARSRPDGGCWAAMRSAGDSGDQPGGRAGVTRSDHARPPRSAAQFIQPPQPCLQQQPDRPAAAPPAVPHPACELPQRPQHRLAVQKRAPGSCPTGWRALRTVGRRHAALRRQARFRLSAAIGLRQPRSRTPARPHRRAGRERPAVAACSGGPPDPPPPARRPPCPQRATLHPCPRRKAGELPVSQCELPSCTPRNPVIARRRAAGRLARRPSPRCRPSWPSVSTAAAGCWARRAAWRGMAQPGEPRAACGTSLGARRGLGVASALPPPPRRGCVTHATTEPDAHQRQLPLFLAAVRPWSVAKFSAGFCDVSISILAGPAERGGRWLAAGGGRQRQHSCGSERAALLSGSRPRHLLAADPCTYGALPPAHLLPCSA